MFRHLLGGLVVLVLVALACLLAVSIAFPRLTWNSRPRRESPPPVPAYPNAQSITQSQEKGYYQITTFDTVDTPEVVLRFYLDRLPQQGMDSWDIDTSFHPSPVAASEQRYIALGCPYIHALTIIADRTAAGSTRVILRITQSMGCG